MFVLSFGRNDSEGMKTIKSEFGGPLSQLISLWRSKSGGHAGREVGLKGGKKNKKNQLFLFLKHVRNLCPLRLQEFP